MNLVAAMNTRMATPYIFTASRWTSGNHLFPTVIEVNEKALIRRKRRLLGCDEISVGMSKVASVHIKTGIFWAEILIESTGGSDPLVSHGHSKSDARQIRDLVVEYQSAALQEEKK